MLGTEIFVGEIEAGYPSLELAQDSISLSEVEVLQVGTAKSPTTME